MDIFFGLTVFLLIGICGAIGAAYLEKHPYPKGYKPEQKKKP